MMSRNADIRVKVYNGNYPGEAAAAVCRVGRAVSLVAACRAAAV